VSDVEEYRGSREYVTGGTHWVQKALADRTIAGLEATKKTLSEGVKTRDAELLNRTRAIAAWETNSDMQQSRIAELEADHASLAYAYDGRYRELLEARASLQQVEAELAQARLARGQDARDLFNEREKCEKLEAENEQLQEDHTAVMGDYIHEVQRVNEAEATIERLKCCGNCEHDQSADDCCDDCTANESRWAERIGT